MRTVTDDINFGSHSGLAPDERHAEALSTSARANDAWTERTPKPARTEILKMPSATRPNSANLEFAENESKKL